MPPVPKAERDAMPRARAVAAVLQGGAAAAGAGALGAGLDHRRRRRADRGRVDGRARLDPRRRRSRGGCRWRCCARRCSDHQAITAMVMFILICAQVFCARVPRAARRGADRGPVRVPARRRQRRHLVPDAADLRARLLHRVDRDQLHRGAAVPAGVRRRRASTWCGWRC